MATTNGVFVVGTSNAGFSTTVATSLTVSGAGALNVVGTTNGNNSNFIVGIGNTTSSTATMTPTLDMSNLGSFSFTTGTGAPPVGSGGNEFLVGVGTDAEATVNLAANSSITAGTVDIGDNSTVTPGAGGSQNTNNSSHPSTLNLGSGQNTIDTNTLIVGAGRAMAGLTWSTLTLTGSLTLAGAAGGISTTNIIVGLVSYGTPSSSGNQQINLDGHAVTVQAGTVTVGQMISGSTGGKVTTVAGGSINFDTGTFTANALNMGVTSSGGSIDQVGGSFVVGSGPSSTGVFTLGSQMSPGSLLVGDDTGGSSTGAAGTFAVKGGTANIYTNIIDDSTAGTSATGVTISGGTLNMEGYAIGPATAIGNSGAIGTRHITTITFPSNAGTLENLGGTGINDAGVVMTGSGTLVLAGVNTYTGGTTVQSGAIAIGSATALPTPTLTFGSATTSGALDLNGMNVPLNSLIIAGGTPVIGNGSTTSNGTFTYTGAGLQNFPGIIQDHVFLAGNKTTAVNVTGGTLNLTGANGYAGGTTVTNSTLVVGSSTALGAAFTMGVNNGAAPGGTTVNAGGILDLSGNTANEPLTLNGGTLANSSASPAMLDTGIKGIGYATATGTSGVGGSSSISIGGPGSSATATPILGVTLATFTITNFGSGYTARPTVTITGGGGTGATANAIFNNITNVITGLSITNPGTGYTSTPTITFSAPTAGTTATGLGNDDNFEILSIQQNTPGTGYTIAPTATFTNTSAAATPAAVTLTAVVPSVNLAATSFVAGTGNITIASAISGLGGLTMTGANTLTLTGQNSYGGTTTVNSGAVVIGAAGSLPTGNAVVNNAAFNVLGNSTSGNITGTGTLTVGDGVNPTTLQLQQGSGGSSQNSLVIMPGSTLDITNNHLFINYGSGPDPISSIAAWISSGFAGGTTVTWTGTGHHFQQRPRPIPAVMESAMPIPPIPAILRVSLPDRSKSPIPFWAMRISTTK